MINDVALKSFQIAKMNKKRFEIKTEKERIFASHKLINHWKLKRRSNNVCPFATWLCSFNLQELRQTSFFRPRLHCCCHKCLLFFHEPEIAFMTDRSGKCLSNLSHNSGRKACHSLLEFFGNLFCAILLPKQTTTLFCHWKCHNIFGFGVVQTNNLSNFIAVWCGSLAVGNFVHRSKTLCAFHISARKQFYLIVQIYQHK